MTTENAEVMIREAIEPWGKIAPDLVSKEAVLYLLKQIYPPEKEKLGMVVLEIVPLS